MPRNPKITKNLEVSKKNKENEDRREALTPAYSKRDFLCPEILTGRAHEAWEETVELIKSMRNSPITDADKYTIQLRANAIANYEYFDSEIKKKPDLYILLAKPGKDNPEKRVFVHVKNLMYDRRKQEADTILKCDSKLGLDPISRAKIGLARVAYDKTEKEEKIAKLLNRKRDDD